jgi:hypothetical protein
MTADTLNLILGLAGLVFGFISAYGQIKTFLRATAKRGLESAKRMIERRERENEIYAQHPSAFLAYAVKRFVTAMALLFAIPFFSALLKANSLGLPAWLAGSLSFAMPALCGTQFGALLSRASDIRDRILKKQGDGSSASPSEEEKT